MAKPPVLMTRFNRCYELASEHALWLNFRKLLRSQAAHACRVENSVGPGTPDVNACAQGVEFWVELKHVAAWPARPETPVDVGLELGQAQWLFKRGRAGGRCWVLVQIAQDYLLFWWADAKTLLDVELDQAGMKRRAAARWHKQMPARELVAVLRGA